MRTRHVVLAIDLDDDHPWWIAHEHPERPVDDWCVWSWDCDACMLHLVAAAKLDGERKADTYRVHANSHETTTVGATLAEALAWRDEYGYPPLISERNP